MWPLQRQSSHDRVDTLCCPACIRSMDFSCCMVTARPGSLHTLSPELCRSLVLFCEIESHRRLRTQRSLAQLMQNATDITGRRTATSKTLDAARERELNHGPTAVRLSQKVVRSAPPSMFEGVTSVDNSRTDSRYTYTRLALGGVRGRSIQERRPSRRVVLAASATRNACLVALLGQRRADSNGSPFLDSRRNGGGKCMRYT